MANPSSIVENDEVCLEWAVTLADEEHIDEFEVILDDSLQEISGNKEFVCSECGKKYKTKGGRKRHVLNKHTSSQNLLSRDDLKHMMEEVVNEVISDGWYGEEIEQQLKILPSTCCDNEVFVSLIQKCYRDMDINNDQDKLMLFFTSNIFPAVLTMFPDNDARFINIMVDLPAKLASCIKKVHSAAVNVSSVSVQVKPLTDQEKGPLKYITGAVISKLYRKSKRSKESESTVNTMLQNLLLSMRIGTELDEYMMNLDRGGLWNPCDLLVTLIEVVELIFRAETSKTVTSIPTADIQNRSLESPDIISHWDAIVHDCPTEVAEECSSSCLENIVKVFITIRSFSHTRNIIEKYKISEKAEKRMKGLRKTLRNTSQQ